MAELKDKLVSLEGLKISLEDVVAYNEDDILGETSVEIRDSDTLGGKYDSKDIDEIKALASVMTSENLCFKGSVQSYGELPTLVAEGDCYYCINDKINYVYSSGEWQECGINSFTSELVYDENTQTLRFLTLPKASGETMIDDSLTLEGEAADSKTVGIKLSALQKLLDNWQVKDRTITKDKFTLDLQAEYKGTVTRSVTNENNIKNMNSQPYIIKKREIIYDKPITLNAYTGDAVEYKYETETEYDILCITDIRGDGDFGLLCDTNGIIMNVTNEKRTWRSISADVLYIRNITLQ